MAQTAVLLQVLKRTLKARGLSYRDVARHLGLSEASVKRLFSTQGFSLKRLDKLCELVGMELSELVALIQTQERALTELTLEQETALVADTRLLLVAFLVIQGWKLADIVAAYALSEAELVRLLARLDRLKIIELQPGNRVKLLTSRQFAWRKDGPIQRFFDATIRTEFFASHFDGPGEALTFVSGMLSVASYAAMLRAMERLAREFDEMNRDDAKLALGERQGCSLALALRAWEPSAFAALRRTPRAPPMLP